MSRPSLAIISDFKIEDILSNKRTIRIGTPFGPSKNMILSKFEDLEIVFISRRELEDELPLRRFNYRANIWGLNKIGVERILSLNHFRALEKKYSIGDIVIPDNLIDFNNLPQSYYDKLLITPMDLSKPFCKESRECLMKSAKALSNKVWKEGILACIGVPRLETEAERKLFTMQGCNLANIGVSPEIFLSRELRICYSSLGLVCSKPNDLRESVIEESVKIEEALNESKQILIKSIRMIPRERGCVCSMSE